MVTSIVIPNTCSWSYTLWQLKNVVYFYMLLATNNNYVKSQNIYYIIPFGSIDYRTVCQAIKIDVHTILQDI